MKDSSYKTENEDIIKVLRSDARFIEAKKDPSKREVLVKEADKLGLKFSKNIGDVKLQELINEASIKAED